MSQSPNCTSISRHKNTPDFDSLTPYGQRALADRLLVRTGSNFKWPNHGVFMRRKLNRGEPGNGNEKQVKRKPWRAKAKRRWQELRLARHLVSQEPGRERARQRRLRRLGLAAD